MTTHEEAITSAMLSANLDPRNPEARKSAEALVAAYIDGRSGDAEAWNVHAKGWGEELRYTEAGAQELADRLRDIAGVKEPKITPLFPAPSAGGETVKALSEGFWEASVYHCPPPRNRRDNPLRNSASIRLHPRFNTEIEALKYAEEIISSGWAGTTIVHKESAKPGASFYLPRDSVDELGRLRSTITNIWVDRAHYAEGVADLAIKHRDYAEAALRLVVEYDDLLRNFTGPVDTITAGENAAIDAAYDKMVAAAIDALVPHDEQPTSGWQPIDTAPKDGTKILLCLTGYQPVVGYFDGEQWEYQERGDFVEEDHWFAWQEQTGVWRPDNWMPLPAAPLASSETRKENGNG